MKAAILLVILVAAAWYFLVQPNLSTEMCPACLGKSAERATAAKTQLWTGPSEPPPSCSLCGNTGKVTPKQKAQYLKQIAQTTPVNSP
jgi:hypothetical protein